MLVENSAEAILLTSEDDSILFANRAACRMLGRPASEIARLTFSTLLDPADARSRPAIEERRQHGSWRGELRLLRGDGTSFTAEASSAVFTDSQGTRLAGTSLRDLTNREKAEQELRHRHELMRYIIEHVRSSVAVLDRDMRYVYVSQRFLDEVNEPGADIIGKCHYDVFPEIPQEWREVHRRALAGEVLSAEADPFRRADGSVYWTRWECRPWYQEEGAIGGIVLYTEVINDRIAAEENRRRLEAQLAQAQKMESIGRLAGGVAHDFNNLLTIINGYSTMALERLTEDDPLREDLAEILKAGERASALTRQLLAFSRKQVLLPELLDLNRVVEELAPMLQRLMGETVRVRLETYRDRLSVLADLHQLEQVIMNLAVNARDAMPGGGEMSIRTARADIDDTTAELQKVRAGKYAVLTVSDTGIGMDEETRRRVFEPFFTTKRVGQGTGLGLSMVDGIVTQSGGFIELDTKPGKGSSFRIHVPAVDVPMVEGAGRQDTVGGLAAENGETVLVVEDQAEVLRFVSEALKAFGYQVIACSNAAEALRISQQPDKVVHVVLTDLVMPDMGGLEFATRFSQLRPKTPVLYMSAYVLDSPQDEPLRAAQIIQKPFTPAELARRLAKVLGHERNSSA